CGDRCAIWWLHAGCNHVPAVCDALSRASGYDQLGLLAGIRNSSSFHIYCHVPVLGAKAGPDDQARLKQEDPILRPKGHDGTPYGPGRNMARGAATNMATVWPIATPVRRRTRRTQQQQK